jgi:ATP phosphoribosyltransferase
MIRMALPDGHQERHVAGLVSLAGIGLSGYDAKGTEEHPEISIGGIRISIIRPQDMPGQVAVGNFDLAITGTDWLLDHVSRFPKSPVEPLLSLGIGRVRVVAVMHEDAPADTTAELVRLIGEGKIGRPFFRIASEYVNLADRFARHHRIARYRVIPTYGATEALLPEDADLIIENTETGSTLAKNRLKIIDELFVSTGCLVGRRGILEEGHAAVTELIGALGRAEGVGPYRAVTF